MDSRQFDRLTRALTEAGSRRGLLGFLATLPLLGGIVALLGADAAEAKKNRRKKPHKRSSRRKKPKQKQRKKHKSCKAHSRAKTCANRCGTVKNNCKKTVDCGSCVCDPLCEICQTCNDRTGVCEPDPAQQGDACGAPGQVCQPDGSCACDASSCAACEECQGDGTCSLPCGGAGCCDGDVCVTGFDDDACGRDGEDCTACRGVKTCGGGDPGTPGVCGCTPSTCPARAKCGTVPNFCGGTVSCGEPCSNPKPVCLDNICVICFDDNQCGDGAVCCGGSCEAGDCCDISDCAGTTPICENHTCTACASHAECGDGFLCLEDGACQACDVTCAAADHTCDGTALQAAMNAGGTVYVCPGRYTGAYTLEQTDVTVIGAGDGEDPGSATILDAQQSGRVVTLHNDHTIALHRLHITGGLTSGAGAGITHFGMLLTMEDCTVSHNATQAAHEAAALGTIMNSAVSQLVMTRCIIRNNSVTNTGEGTAIGGGVYNLNQLEMTDCVIRDNTAKTAGGGLYNYHIGTADLTRCRITDNTLTTPISGSTSGGGIHVESGAVSLTDSFVWNNTPPDCFGTVVGDGCGALPPD